MTSAHEWGRHGVAHRVVLGCALLAWSPCALALNPALDVSQYAHTAWKIRDGFTRGVITSVAQTPDGYLWLGTEFGLLRFDGVRHVLWQPRPDQRLPSDFIVGLLATRDGTLWIGTSAGLARRNGDTLIRFEELEGFQVRRIIEDWEGSVWVTAASGAATGKLCAIRQGKIRCYGPEEGIDRSVFGLYQDRKGALWVGVRNGVWRWNPEPRTFYELPRELNGFQALGEDTDGALLIGMGGGIRRLVDGKTEVYPLPGVHQKFQTRELLRDRHGSLWIATFELGLVHVHGPQADVFTAADGLTGSDMLDLFEDREGSIWAATMNGLDRFRDFPVPTFTERQGLLTGQVWAVLGARDGTVWLGTPSGLNRWTNGRITIAETGRSSRAGMLNGEHPQSLFEDRRGRIWVSTSTGLGYLDDDRFVSIPGAPAGNVHAIAEDSAGDVWISNVEAGVFRVSQQNGVQRMPPAALGRQDPVSAIAGDRLHGGVWLGFQRGGVAHVADGQVRASFSTADGLGGGRVSGLRLDRDGTLWAATAGGLGRVTNGRAATLTSANGLPCDAVYWAIDDDAGSVWLYMPCGLVRLARSELDGWAAAIDSRAATPPTLRPTVFGNSDGVRVKGRPGGYGPAVSRSADGTFWFTSFDGVSLVDPARLPVNTLKPPVHIEQVVADLQTYRVTSEGGDSLRLPPLVRDLQIDYTALSLVAPEMMRFRYLLEGHDPEWQDVGTRRQAFYNDLPPGTYRFRVTASNNSGVWNEEGATIDFSIAPAYYQTWWFVVLSAGLVLAAGWAAHRLRLRIVERHEREISALNERLMKAQEQERIRIAGELHDGVMQEMLAVTMMLGTAKRRVAGDADTKAVIDKVQDKVIRVGADIRRVSHALHPPVLQEAGLPQALQLYCEEFSDSAGIPVSCEADDNARDLSRGAALALFRIVQEALGNAAKHAAAKRITVCLTRSAHVVSLQVSDDGVGFDRGQLSAAGGLGLITMRERASQLDGTFDFDSAPGRGTTIRVAIPFR